MNPYPVINTCDSLPQKDKQRKMLDNFPGDSDYCSRIIKVVITS